MNDNIDKAALNRFLGETVIANVEKALNGESSDALCGLGQRVAALRAENKRLTAENERLRGYARRLLLQEMHEISEACACAQWLGDWGADLWRWILDPSLPIAAWGGLLSDYTDRAALIQLIRDADGWWSHWDTFVDLRAWERGHGSLPAAEAAPAEKEADHE